MPHNKIVNTTSVLGFLIFIGTFAMLFYDMYLSKHESYHFELDTWHVVVGIFSGVALILLPEKEVREYLSKILNKWLKK